MDCHLQLKYHSDKHKDENPASYSEKSIKINAAQENLMTILSSPHDTLEIEKKYLQEQFASEPMQTILGASITKHKSSK